MSNIDHEEERLKQHTMGIRWQVVSESINRDDIEKFKLLKTLFVIECVDDDISEHFLTWIENMIQEQLRLRLQIKDMMRTGIEDSISINGLQSDSDFI